jgi:hypothetical protein
MPIVLTINMKKNMEQVLQENVEVSHVNNTEQL